MKAGNKIMMIMVMMIIIINNDKASHRDWQDGAGAPNLLT